MVYDLSVARARDPLIAITVFAFIALLSTGMRLGSRRIRQLSFAKDDYLMVAALFCLLISIGIQFVSVLAGGLGRHVEDVYPADVVKILKLILPIQVLYGITLCLVKCSVVCFYLRVFGDALSFRISAYIAIAVFIMWAISVILEALLLCRPFAFNWDPTIPGGVCGDRNRVYVSAGILNVVTDFMVIALPVPHILGLKLILRRKLGLLFMFTMGIFITIISIIRIRSIQTISFADPTFTFSMSIFWTTLEPCLCVINANLPMVRTLFVDLAPGIFGLRGGKGTKALGMGSERSRGLSLFESTVDGRDIEKRRNEGMVDVKNTVAEVDIQRQRDIVGDSLLRANLNTSR